jgi:hypothetical protein
VEGFRRRAVELGARVLPWTAVTRIARRESRVLGAETSAGRIDVGHVVVIDEMNAKHEKDYAHRTKEETIQLLQKGAAVVRGLSADQLAKSGRAMLAAPGADGTALPTDFEELHVSRPVAPVSRLRPAPAQVLRLRVWSLSPNHALAEGEFMRMPTPLSRVVPAPMSCPGPIGG